MHAVLSLFLGIYVLLAGVLFSTVSWVVVELLLSCQDFLRGLSNAPPTPSDYQDARYTIPSKNAAAAA